MTTARFRPGQRVRDDVVGRDLWIRSGPHSATTGGRPDHWCCCALAHDDGRGPALHLLVPDIHLSPLEEAAADGHEESV